MALELMPFQTQRAKYLVQPIQYWGNLDSKKGRKAYPKLREYMFLSLVARTPDIDWIALDKGQRTVDETVNMLMLTMEEYINYGLSVLAEKIKESASKSTGYIFPKFASCSIPRQSIPCRTESFVTSFLSQHGRCSRRLKC